MWEEQGSRRLAYTLSPGGETAVRGFKDKKKKLKRKFPLLLGSCTKPKMKPCFRMVYPMGFASGGPGKQEKGVGEYNLAALPSGRVSHSVNALLGKG